MIINTNHYTYTEQQVSFVNKHDEITFYGTLSLPASDKKLPAVVLIAGTGKHDRDLNFPGKHLFSDIADYLAKQGIIVLRYDKRGCGRSEGVFNLSCTSEDFARDAHYALDFLRKQHGVDHTKIGCIGHSEGGLISIMLAAQVSDQFPVPNFIITLAAGVVNDPAEILQELSMQLKADGASEHFVEHDAKMRKQLFDVVMQYECNIAEPMILTIVRKYLAELTDTEKDEARLLSFAFTEESYAKNSALFNSPWFRYFIHNQPALRDLPKVTIPFLALNGDKDFVVASMFALPIIKKYCPSQDLTVMELQGYNHWFQQCAVGSMMEYNQITGTIHQEALGIIAEWILKRFE